MYQGSRGRVRGRGQYRNHNRNVNRTSRPPSANPGLANSANCANQRNISHTDSHCCAEVQIRLELNMHSENFFVQLKNMWNMVRRCEPVINMLHNHLNACQNPYEEAIRLTFNCKEFNSAKSKLLPFFIMEEFQGWSRLSRNKIVHMLTVQLKVDAFKIFSKQNTLLLTKLAVDVYEMQADNHHFLDLIKCMIEKKMYREACQSVLLLGLQDSFKIQDFLLPLVLQDKLSIVDDFLRYSPAHQYELVGYLDSVLGEKSCIRDSLYPFIADNEILDVHYEKLHSKPWRKLIARFVKMFKLPSDLTPNLNKKRNEGTLQFLLHKRFIDNTFGHESWKEMAQEAVGDDEDLQKELVSQLDLYGEISEALYWAHFYNVPRENWPQRVRQLEDEPPEVREQQRNMGSNAEENWDELEAPLYHKYPLPFDTIHLVDSVVSFENFLDTGLQGVDIVGIDCEWKPNFAGQGNELALMQIATRNNVFILDIISVSDKAPHLWQELGTFLFNNCEIVKLGFGLITDFSMIKKALPEINLTQKAGFLDLLTLYRQLEKHQDVVFPYEVHSGGPSLSTLVQHCFGKALDKSDQFSNWEKRPLRESQLEYAALDAYCLIQIYDVFRQCCEGTSFSFDEACYNLLTNEKMPKKKSKKSDKNKPKQQPEQGVPQPPNPYTRQIFADELKVVCDTMLEGLGKNLRRCGIDCAILSGNADHMDCVRYAQDEYRYILTRGTTFNKLSGYVPAGHCLRIISDNVDEQLKEVLEYYHVVVTKDHVFTRCQVCNGNSFVKVSSSTMSLLADSQPKNICPPPPCIDEASGFSSDEDYFDDFEVESTRPPRVAEAGPPIGVTRKWDLYSDEKINIGQRRTKLGASIQVDAVPKAVIGSVSVFYVCEECGKVYWDGSHLGKVLSGRLQGIVQ